jgi:uncharacterized membrane protein
VGAFLYGPVRGFMLRNLFLAAIPAGVFASYALSLQLFRRFLRRHVRSGLVAPTILFVHALCAVAMYLGRRPPISRIPAAA